MIILGLLITTMAFGQDAVLKHSYTFEEGTYDETTVYDQVGTANGTLGGDKISIANGGATVSGATVNSDGWISFDGTEIGLATFTNGGITLEAYLETGNVLNSGYTMLAYFGTGTPGNGCFWVQPTRAGNETRIETNNTSSTITASLMDYEVDDGKKHHLVATLSSDALTYYLDGVIIAETSTGGADYISTIGTEVANLFRGVDGWNDPNYNATLDEFNIYDGVIDHSTLVNHAGEFLGIELDNVLLASITSTLGTFNVPFDPENLDYELTVPYGTTSINLTAVPDASVSTVTMIDGLGNEITDGNVTFGNDGVDIEIIVTGADGFTSVSYYVAVFTDAPELVSTLSDIQLSSGTLSPEFDTYTTDYTVYIPEGTNSVDLTAVPVWDGEIITGDGTIDMSSGQASTVINVTSEDGSSSMAYNIDLYWTVLIPGNEYYVQHELSKYVLTGVDRSAPQISPAVKDDSTQLFTIIESDVPQQYYLKNRKGLYLQLANTANVWDMTMRDNITVDADSSKFTFDEFEPGRFTMHAVKRAAFTNDLCGTNNISVGGVFSDKWPGNGLANWNLLPADKVYYPSDNTLASISLDVVALRPTFTPLRFDYTVVLPYGTTSMTLDAEATDATASISGTGSIDVSDGEGTAVITVTAADGQSSKEYKVHYKVDHPAEIVHSYTFADGTAMDQVGTADGEVHGGTIADGAFTSTVDGDYIVLPSEDIAINTYSSITLEAYVLTGENPAWTMLGYFGNTSGGSDCFWMTIARNDNVSRAETATYGGATNANGVEPGVGELHHVVAELSNDTISLYLDGSLSAKTATGADYLISQIATSRAWICYGAYNDPTYKGTIYEFNIYEGLMDEATIAERANNFPVEDETSNATITDLMVDGVTVEGFSPYVMDYTVSLPGGTSDAPAVTATTKNDNASVDVADAATLPGTTTVTVTAADGTTTLTYTITWAVPLSSNAALADIMVDGASIEGFDGKTLNYIYNVPEGTTDVPVITVTTADANATAEITAASGIPGTTTILVTAQDGTTKTYKVNFQIASAVGSLDNALILVYPTISNSDFKVKTDRASSIVTIFNAAGSQIIKQEIEGNEATIQVPKQGMYFIQVETNGAMRTFKVIKTN